MKKKELLKRIEELELKLVEAEARILILECNEIPSAISPYIVTIEPTTTAPWEYPRVPITTCVSGSDIVGCSTAIMPTDAQYSLTLN